MKLIARMLLIAAAWVAFSDDTGAQQLMPPDLIKAYKSVLPATDEPLAREVFDSQDTIWYSHAVLHPRTQAYQFPNERFGGRRGVMQGVHSVYSNPGPNNQSQANREYPWALTLGGGSHRADNVKTAKAFLLPRDEDGNLKPAVVFGTAPMRVCFPVGTIFAELAWMVDSDGKWHPFEARFRIRERGSWNTSRMVPFKNRSDLVSAVAETHPQIASVIATAPAERQRIRAAHPRPLINDTAWVVKLPDFPAELTNRILARPFVAIEDEIEFGGGADWITTEASFHIRPKGDTTANHGTGGRNRCAVCHGGDDEPGSIGRHARIFDMNREWYLTVRGLGDGNFSWHPWSDNMPSQMGNPNNLRQSWLDHGIVARFDPEVHTNDWYNQSDALKQEIARGVN